jgi:hypothetical protein
MLGAGDGPALGAALGGSTGAAAVPVVIIGGLFLVAASVDPGRNEGSPAAGRTGSALPTESSRRPDIAGNGELTVTSVRFAWQHR